MATPMSAAPRPTPRSLFGSSRAAAAMRLRICSVNPAISKPSMAKTRPIAAAKSRMSFRLGRRRRRGGRRRSLWRRRRRGEVTEEVRLGAHQRPGLPVLESALVGLHRAVEGEELRVGAVGLGEDAVAFAVALAADLLGLLLRLGGDDGDLAVRLRPDLLSLLRALRAIGGRALLPLGLHAVEHRLGIL